MSTNEKVGKLPARRAGLRQKLGYCELQQAVGKKERRLQRQAGDGGFERCRIYCVVIERLVIKPAQILLKNVRNDLQQPLRWHALAIFDHRQVGHGWSGLGIDLHAPYRQVFKRQAISLPQRLDFCASKMGSTPQALIWLHVDLVCEINIVKFLL